MPQYQRRFLRTLSFCLFPYKRLRCIYYPSIFICVFVVPKFCATDPIFFSFCYVSSFTAVSFVLINFLSQHVFDEISFPESLLRIYFHGIDFYSRSIVTADSQQQPLDLEHYYKSLSTFLRLTDHTRGHHSLSARDL